MFFYLPNLPGFFSEIANNPMRALDRKKHILVMRGLNLMRALI